MTRSAAPSAAPEEAPAQAGAPEAQERVTVSSIPISHEAKTQNRSIHLDVPARWLDMLLITANTLPYEQGEAAVVASIIDTLSVLLPTWGIGACLVSGLSASQEVTKVTPEGEEHRGVGVNPTRLFPGYAHERVYDVEGNGTGTTLHIAGDDPQVNDERAAPNLLVMRAAQVMQRGLDLARRWEKANRTGEELRQLNSHLVQAEKLASLGQIAAGVVHELNNPLTSIVAYTDYLTRRAHARGGDADDLERLRRIGESAGRMLRFTRDLVAYARPSNETPVAMSIHTVIDQALAFCEHILEESGASVQRLYSEDLPLVQGVPGQLAQVFVNLVTNACHAMPPGQGILTVKTERLAESDVVVVMLEDNGHGISAENMPHIFAPFFTTKTDGRGTGLGLSIVRNILESHAAQIRAECIRVHDPPSRPREKTGTRFVLQIPARSR